MCGEGVLRVTRLKPEGRAELDAAEREKARQKAQDLLSHIKKQPVDEQAHHRIAPGEAAHVGLGDGAFGTLEALPLGEPRRIGDTTVSLHPADRFTYQMTIKRETAPG